MDSTDDTRALGETMFGRVRDLFPYCRSITGDGVRQTLRYLRDIVPEMVIHEVPSGTEAFDWTVPDEWNIRDAYVEDETGERVVDFRESNLHVVGYSEPVDRWLDLEDLDPHLYSLPEFPDAIPYVTSYYRRHWGFCLTHSRRQQLAPGRYHAVIDSTLKPGHLTYGEIVIPGDSEQEVLVSTNICHPSLANNELSGPAVATSLAEWLRGLPRRRYTHRFLFIPETIGSIVHLSRNLEVMQRTTVAGFTLTCVGDDRAYSLKRSRRGDTLADRVAKHVLNQHAPGHVEYAFSDYGFADERQYCSPGVDLPVVSLMRSRLAGYPEYHTSRDNLSFVSPGGLLGGFHVARTCLEILDGNYVYRTATLCDPQLGRRGLYPNLSTRTSPEHTRVMMGIIAYADGSRDMVEIADLIGADAAECIAIAERLHRAQVMDRMT